MRSGFITHLYKKSFRWVILLIAVTKSPVVILQNWQVLLFYFDLEFDLDLDFDSVRELLIYSEKRVLSPAFEDNAERSLCYFAVEWRFWFEPDRPDLNY